MTTRRAVFHIAYSSRLPYVCNRFFSVMFAALLIALASPILLVLAFIIKVVDGGPVLYQGIRLGLNKATFTMYKFRTLIPDAEKIIGARLFPPKQKLTTPLGKFLRDTRLDELPQLFNILKGDMDFIGPRPERPAIYEELCKHIRGYDKRFTVTPGLIGYSQLFTPHNTPKRIRAMIDNRFINKKHALLGDLGIVLYTIILVLQKTCQKVSAFLLQDVTKIIIFRKYKEKRFSPRVQPRDVTVYLGRSFGDAESITDADAYREEFNEKTITAKGKLININDEAILINTDKEIQGENFIFKMTIRHKNGIMQSEKTKTALCIGNIYRSFKENNQMKYVIKYKPVSPLHYYLVHKYFIGESFAR